MKYGPSSALALQKGTCQKQKGGDFTGFGMQFGGIRGQGCARKEESLLDVRSERVAKSLAEAPGFENLLEKD